MRARVLVMALLLQTACTKKTPYYCDENTPCQISGTVCNLDENNCIEAQDGPSGGDGATPDGPPGPVVMTYQPASLVLGQPNFDSASDAGCVPTSAAGRSIAVSNDVLYLRESGFRALSWTPVPSANNVAATHVVGKANFTDCTAPGTLDSAHFGATGDLAAASGKLLISDDLNNRILWWTPAPASDGPYADGVLGQTTFAATASGAGANQLGGPAGIWTDGVRVLAADRGNNRVLLWRSFPNSNAEPADVVLGQSAFGIGTAPSAPTASNLLAPSAVWSDGTRVFVSDTGHNRVLIWNAFPSTNGATADHVLGQPSFTSGGSGLSSTALYQPRGLAGNADALFVADTTNDRVMVYSPLPTTDNAPATYVLGQPDLDVGGNQPAPSDRSLALPFGVAIVGDYLWVADFGHKRTLRFELYPP